LFWFAVFTLAPALAQAEPAPQPSSEQATPAPADSTAGPKIPEKVAGRTDFLLSLTTLDALRKKGTITEDEYNAALRDLITVGSRAKSEPTFIVGRFFTTLYGFLQMDFIHDTQRYAADSAGNSNLNLTGTRAADLGRSVMTPRGTRLGLRFGAPDFHGVRMSGNFEMDFLGNEPGAPPRSSPAPSLAESAFFTQPVPRIRHALLKADTDYVTLWIGQTWNLMAFQGAFIPTSVQFPGLPGALFGRTPQIRLSHIFDAKAVSVEVAAAALRPPQFDSEIPDLQGGIKFNVNGWTGVQTIGATGTTISPASIAVTGATRTFKLATSTTGDATASVTGNALAINAMIPLIPAKERGALSFIVLGGFTTGSGYGDLFTNLNGGIVNIGRPSGIAPIPPSGIDPYAALQDVDLGMVGFDNTGTLRTIDWQSLTLTGEIHFGPAILAGTFSNLVSGNIDQFQNNQNAWYHEWFWDANLIADLTPSFRMGAEFARTFQRRLSGTAGNNSRLIVTGWFLF
jgi:hypothetical protein